MPATYPITQRDVAQACGLHPSTVCLALKNSPSIPEATRRKIQAIAEELGYQPNVAARNLALMRTDKRQGSGLPIAWINQEPRRDHWRSNLEARACFEGAQKRAMEVGYRLEEFWTREAGMNDARIVQILRARGIEGVIFPAHRSFDFSLLNQGWSDFAMMGLNDQRLSEWLDVVCPDAYRNMDTTWQRLRRVGLERIGLVLTSQFDAATGGLAHGCFLRRQAELAGDDRVPVCFATDAETVSEWLREHRPEAVISCEPFGGDWRGESVNEVVRVQLQGGIGEACDAGIDAGAAEVAAAAVDAVVDKMRRFERGVREATRIHLIKGTWHERGLVQRVGVGQPHAVVA